MKILPSIPEAEKMKIAAAVVAVADTEPAAVAEIHLPVDISWDMLNKSRFFILGATLFSGISAALYPAVVLKTRLQVARTPLSSAGAAGAILRHGGPAGFYRGFATSLAGTIPARGVYMAALEFTRSTVGTAAARVGAPEPAAAAAASAAGGLIAAMAAQVVWTPIDVITQRLMVQGSENCCQYIGGLDAFKKIVTSDGVRGLYRGFGMSILTYAPSNAVWWASYSVSQSLIWELCELRPEMGAVVVVQGMSAAVAGGAAAMVTMPLDTVKTRMQVEGGEMMGTVRSLVREGGWGACYRGLGPRWMSMSLSAMAMITTYEFLKRLSAKDQQNWDPCRCYCNRGPGPQCRCHPFGRTCSLSPAFVSAELVCIMPLPSLTPVSADLLPNPHAALKPKPAAQLQQSKLAPPC